METQRGEDILYLNIFRILVAATGLYLSTRGTFKGEIGMALLGQCIGLAVLVSFAFTGIS